LPAGPLFAPQLPALAQAFLPLHGVTVLAVEDSRFACEALRLMCQRAGARLRRAETIANARAHLRVYRPDVVIVDLGLPDGRGESLIRDLVLSARRPWVLLGSSGNPDGRAAALAAGADGFLDKPLESLSCFVRTLSRHLPEMEDAAGFAGEDSVAPDPLALHDDLAQAAASLAQELGPAERRYVTGFVRGLARHAHDTALEAAALIGAADQTPGQDALAHLRQMISSRLTQTDVAFGPKAKPA
jgi:DNA-binding response OmpR family regulator